MVGASQGGVERCLGSRRQRRGKGQDKESLENEGYKAHRSIEVGGIPLLRGSGTPLPWAAGHPHGAQAQVPPYS